MSPNRELILSPLLNVFKMRKILIVFAVLISASISTAQVSYQLGFEQGTGIAGFESQSSREEAIRFSSGIKENRLGLSWQAGLINQFNFGEKSILSLQVNALYNQTRFQRSSILPTIAPSPSLDLYFYDFNSQRIVSPVKANLKVGRFILSFGIVNNWNIMTKMVRYSESPFFTSTEEYITGEDTQLALLTFANTEFEHIYSMQLNAGLGFQIHKNWQISLDIYHFIKSNRIEVNIFDEDVFYDNSFSHQTNSLHLSIKYFLQEKEL